jgi:hypothetical protein
MNKELFPLERLGEGSEVGKGEVSLSVYNLSFVRANYLQANVVLSSSLQFYLTGTVQIILSWNQCSQQMKLRSLGAWLLMEH